jgi:hypothetical protein
LNWPLPFKKIYILMLIIDFLRFCIYDVFGFIDKDYN